MSSLNGLHAASFIYIKASSRHRPLQKQSSSTSRCRSQHSRCDAIIARLSCSFSHSPSICVTAMHRLIHHATGRYEFVQIALGAFAFVKPQLTLSSCSSWLCPWPDVPTTVSSPSTLDAAMNLHVKVISFLCNLRVDLL